MLTRKDASVINVRGENLRIYVRHEIYTLD